jgi:transposase InsO family protein
MPWKEHRVVDLREKFVLAALEPGAQVAELSREYGVSRKTAYKWLERFRKRGSDGLLDMSRRPHRYEQTKGELVLGVLEARGKHQYWGPKKLQVVVRRRYGEAPSTQTIARILKRAGEPLLRRRRTVPVGRPTEVSPRVDAGHPNAVWTVDFKGWWLTGDNRRFEPLTVRDAFSRFIFKSQYLASTRGELVRGEFEELFQKYGLPDAIQMDNGSPFASTKARAGLTALSAWWVSLGIRLVRSRPGCPQDNAGHERSHLDMSQEVEVDPAANHELQQAKMDAWRQEFNEVRPHEALGMKTPAEVYVPSQKRYLGPRTPRYPREWDMKHVYGNGTIRIRGRRVFVSAALVHHVLGLQPLGDEQVRAWFYDVDLGVIDYPNEQPPPA